ncbi:MAG TPA: sensor histidine kinase [Nocardioidaceae bacterium]|nr:sensor histidine kinase [Nocardioidaceae bacterium]
MRRRLSLAGQLLVLQAVIVLIVVLGVAAVTLIQNEVAFGRQEGRAVLATAETVANTLVVERGLAEGTERGVPGVAENFRATSRASYVIVTDADGTVIYSPFPDEVSTRMVRPNPKASWVGVTRHDGDKAVEARVPVEDATAEGGRIGEVVGYVIVGREYPTLWGRLGDAAPSLAIYVGVGSLVSLGGSLLLSRRIKRQTLGLEPDEISGLVEHREAMLHGLREGVLAVDRAGRVTMVNDEARRLLDLAADVVGSPVGDLPLPATLTAVLRGDSAADDLAVVTGGQVLVVNQMPVQVREQKVGWVTTVRDRTELVDLNRQLDVWRGTTDALRSQAHEFSNRMHTIAGLIELEEYAEAAQFVTAQSTARAGWVDRVTSRVRDAAVAAILVAKDSRATELGVRLELDDDTLLPAVPDSLSADLLTVVGNLVDNAMEAAAPTSGTVSVGLVLVGGAAVVRVRDDGPGVAPGMVDRVFEQGFSTKSHQEPGARGWGLALSRVVCEKRGGGVVMDRVDARTVFTATLPVAFEAEEVDA